MFIENRNNRRFVPKGVMARIFIESPSNGEMIVVEGSVLDMSYGGIKIKLRERLPQIVEEAELRILLVLPESGVKVSIHGIIKHVTSQDQCGLQYAECYSENEIDDLMFECIKHAADVQDNNGLA